MTTRRVLALLLPLAIACGDPAREDNLGQSSGPLEVTAQATDVGIEDAVFRRVDSHAYPLLTCPLGAPFVCRTDENALGWTCSELPCPPPEETLRYSNKSSRTS